MSEPLRQDIPHLETQVYVSCRFRTLLCMARHSDLAVTEAGHFTNWGASPRYPSSASTRSPSSRLLIRASRKIITSLYLPGGYGPFTQTMSPPMIEIATSYRRPDPLNLWLKNFFPLRSIWKSVPSMETRQSLSTSPFLRFSQTI
jgi:hypothetical protein